MGTQLRSRHGYGHGVTAPSERSIQDETTQDDITQDDITQDDITQDDITQDDITQDEIQQLISSRKYYEKKSRHWKKEHDDVVLCTSITFAIILALFCLCLVFSITMESISNNLHRIPPSPKPQFSPPWVPDHDTVTRPAKHPFYKRKYHNKNILIKASRPKRFYEVPGIFSDLNTHLTYAHMGWMFMSPTAVLNLDKGYLHSWYMGAHNETLPSQADAAQVRRDLKTYVEGYLKAPWGPEEDSFPVCRNSTMSLFNPKVCEFAWKRFDKYHDLMLAFVGEGRGNAAVDKIIQELNELGEKTVTMSDLVNNQSVWLI
jgi:hypothetical protein